MSDDLFEIQQPEPGYEVHGNGTLKFTTTVVSVVLAAAALAFAASIVWTVLNNASLIEQTRIEQCEALRAEHDRERARIVQSVKLLYELPEFKTLIATPKAERVAYQNARHNYHTLDEVVPPYCPDYKRESFPPLSEVRKGVSG